MDGFATPYGGRPGFTGTGSTVATPGYGLPSAFPSSSSMDSTASLYSGLKSPGFNRFSPTHVDKQRSWDMMQLQSKLADMQALITTTEDVFNNKGTDGNNFNGTGLGASLNSRMALASSNSSDPSNRLDSSFASNGGTGGSHPHSLVRHQSSAHGFRSHHMKHTTPQVDVSLCPITEGRMTKKGGETATFTGGRPWRERYCKLEGTELVWYEKQGSKVVKDRFPITSSVQVTSGATDRQHKNKSIKFDFELTDPEKNESRSLYSDTEQEAKNWIATIEYVVEKCIEAEANAAATEATQGGEYAEEASLQANLYAIDGMLANLQASVAGAEMNNTVPQDVAAFMLPLDPAEIERLKDEAQCHTAYGSGLYEAVRGEPASFLIQACTPLGDPKVNGGDNFVVTLESEDYPDLKWDLIPQDNGDGTYSIEYTPTRVGEWSLRVLVNGQYDIYGSPFHPVIQRAPTSSTHCLVKGEGTTVARIDSTNTFTIVARDIYDDERGVGGDSFEITILGPGLANPIIDNGDGTYTVSYDIDTQSAVFKAASVVKPPTLELHIALNNPGFPYPRIIKDSPFTPRVEMVPRATPVAPPPPPPVAQSNVTAPPPPPSTTAPPPPPPPSSTVVTESVPVPTPAPAPPSPPITASLPPPPPPVTIDLPKPTESISTPPPPVVEVPPVPVPTPVPAPATLPPPPTVPVVTAPPSVVPVPVPAPVVLRPEEDPEVIRVRAELAAKEKEIREAMAAVDEQRKRLEEERRKVEEDNRQVTERMARLREVSTKVKELSEKNIEQARAMQMVKSQLAAAAQVSPQQLPNNPLASPQYIPTPSQPNFDGSSSNLHNQSQLNTNTNSNNNISPGTTYTRQTYNTYDDNASIYTRATAPPQAYAAVLNSPAYIQLQSMEPVMFTNPATVPTTMTDDYGSVNPPSSTVGGGSLRPTANYTGTESPGELFDIDVMALFDKHRIAVRDLWSFYAAMSRGSDGLRGTANGLDIKRYVILMQDYDICPTFVTKKELKQIFIAASRAHSGSSTTTTTNANDETNLIPLSYAAFVEALGRTALTALAKPAFVTLYPTAFDKVKVLLEMWGIADNRKLQEIQNNLREAGNSNNNNGSSSSSHIPSGQSVGGKSKTASVATSGRKSRSNRQ